MRNRAFLLLVLAGILSFGAGAARGVAMRGGDHAADEAARARSSMSRVEASEVAALVAAARIRDPLDRDGERRTDAFAFLAGLAALAVAAWWVAVRQRAHVHRASIRVGTRPRAPPAAPALVVPSS